MKTVFLSEVIDLNPSPPRDYPRTSEQQVTFLPMAAVSEFGEADYSLRRSIKEVSSGFTYFQKNDILVAKITPCMENGKAVYLKDLPTDIGFGSTEFHVLRAKTGLLSSYLFFLVWNENFRLRAKARMVGSAGQKRVPPSFFSRYEVPLPSESEQLKISQLFESLMAANKLYRRGQSETARLLKDLSFELLMDRRIHALEL